MLYPNRFIRTCVHPPTPYLWVPSAQVNGNAPGVGHPNPPISASLARLTQLRGTPVFLGTAGTNIEVYRGPGLSFPKANKTAPKGALLECSGWQYGSELKDLWTHTPDTRWYRLTPDGEALLFDTTVRFPMAQTGWNQTYGSSFHKPGKGYQGADDTHALDLNLSGDKDNGKAVYPVAYGIVRIADPGLGYVLVQHFTPLTLKGGAAQSTWFTGYMHMTGIATKDTIVNPTRSIGHISNKTRGNSNLANHLHFAFYVPSRLGSLQGLKSVDINTLPTAFTRHISAWFDWRGAKCLTIMGPLAASALGA